MPLLISRLCRKLIESSFVSKSLPSPDFRHFCTRTELNFFVVQKSAGGILLPKSAVKFERYLVGEVLSVGAEAEEVEAGQKVLLSDVNAYEVSSVVG
ncbi:10 kDa chaperonin 1, chloroplastic [Linum perenne]